MIDSTVVVVLSALVMVEVWTTSNKYVTRANSEGSNTTVALPLDSGIVAATGR